MDGLTYKKWYESKEFYENGEAPEAELGALYTPESTVFRVWAPGAEQILLKLYAGGTVEEAAEPEKVLAMQKSSRLKENGVWELEVPEDCDGVYYTYEVMREGRSRECVDIYARACGANGKRGMVVNLAKTNPEGWDEDALWTQKNTNTVIYELHVKDFSYHQDSGIPREHRGKYLAFTDRTGERTGVEYLKWLGISHVHLLPVFDYASVEETGDGDQFNWGYDPQNYNIPEGSYATDARHGEVRIREFKQMVQALHQAGIGVIMDVVYNHTFSADSSFQVLVPFYYYRQNEDGTLSDGSACGNETASERTMCGKFILESVLYWAKEYHIDGFRFDLMGLHDTETMNRIRQELDTEFPYKHILMYGEPWTAAASPMAKGYYPAVKSNIDRLEKGIAIFSDNTRDSIKGNVFYGDVPGFVNGARGLEKEIASAYQAWCDGGHDFAPVSPAQIISYVSAHDNYTLWDKLELTLREPALGEGEASEGQKTMPEERSTEQKKMPGEVKTEQKEELEEVSEGDKAEHQTAPEGDKAEHQTAPEEGKVEPERVRQRRREQRILRQNKLAAGIVFTCLGTPFLQAGEEFCRTKYGDENSYKSSPSINCLDWNRRERFSEMAEYYRGLIALRGEIPLYRNQTPETLESVTVHGWKEGQVEICLDLSGYECRWRRIYIVANASGEEAVTNLPEGKYQKLADENSSWQWKKSPVWSKMKKKNKVMTAPGSLGIWGEVL